MKIHEALAEIRRLFPDANDHGARMTVRLPNDPGWKCMVHAWSHDRRINVFGRGETFEGAIADAIRRERE